MQTPNFLTFAALALALTAPLVPAFAQAPPTAAPGHGQHGGRLKKMADELGLTDAQKAQMKPILDSARQQAKAIKEDTTLSDDARKAKLKDLRKSSQAQMMAILTPDQRAKLKTMRQERRGARKGTV